MSNIVFELYKKINEDINIKSILPVASLAELSQLELKYDSEKYIFTLKEDKNIVCILPMIEKEEKLYGINMRLLVPIGYDFFDYSAFYTLDNKFINILLSNIIQFVKKIKIDAVFIPSLLLENESKLINKHSKIQYLNIFDSQLSDTEWDNILKKKDIRRVLNSAMKEYGYKAISYENDLIIDELDFIAQTHIERWKFDSINSRFNYTERKDIYSGFLKNKVLLKINLKNEWLCYLYGMRFDDKFAFHTPVINIKYLHKSPLKVLIAETFRYCKENNIRILDFGLGNEEYKKRYSNKSRKIYTFFYPSSTKAKAFNLIFPKHDPQFIIDNIIRIRNFKHRFQNLANVRKIYDLKASTISHNRDVENIFSLSNFEDFVDYSRETGFTILREHYNRFKRNELFLCLEFDSSYVASIWVKRGNTLNKNNPKEDFIMVYDFSSKCGDDINNYKILIEYCINELNFNKIKTYFTKSEASRYLDMVVANK